MIVVDFRHVGTTAWLSEVLKISVRTSVSCAAQSFSTRPGMLSGPAAFRGMMGYSKGEEAGDSSKSLH